MLMSDIVQQISFNLGIPANNNVEDLQIEQAVEISFRELKAYMKTPTNKSVPYSPRIDLLKQGIHTVKVLYVFPAYPKVGLALSNVDSGNIFALAASVKSGALATIGNTQNLDPIVQQLAMSQAANVLSQDFQWTYDIDNQVVYCTCKQARPPEVTIRYVPDYQDVSEIKSNVWINYLIRLSEANMKKALGRSRSKYTIEGSNVSLDGDILLQEANAELSALREELEGKKRKIRILN